MRAGVISVALALCALCTAAEAQTIVRRQPALGFAGLASEGIGYSVVQVPAAPARSFRVVLVCTVAWRNAVAHCPSPAHSAYCPGARIVCR